jgi:CopG family nickel-responsive transcriptional regulator
LVRKSIIEAHIESEDEDVIGTLTIIYDHDVGDVTNELQHFQHFHLSEIIAPAMFTWKNTTAWKFYGQGKSKKYQEVGRPH